MSSPERQQSIILVDDEKHLRHACTQALELAGLSVQSFPSAEGVLDELSSHWPGIVVTDIRMPGQDGLALMADILTRDSAIPVILISGHGDVPMAVQAMRDGAYDFIEKPFPSDMLVDAVRRALEKRRLVLENRALREALDTGVELSKKMIGTQPSIVQLRQQVLDLANVQVDVLITGETGVGKDLVARSLHEQSTRADARFVAINCGGLPDNVIESELFGHEAGAFSGATEQRIGKFEHASGGTLFLDEIESMPLELQIKLLRVLQDRVVVRLGSNLEIPVDVRVVAASKIDLLAACAEGSFREDLYYRLNVVNISVPPLRERRDDIPLLFQAFVDQIAKRHHKEAPEISTDTIASLVAHDWPGNVRELQNVATRFALGLAIETTASQVELMPEHNTLAEKVNAFERQVIESAIREHQGSLKATYEALGVSRKTLYDKIQKHGIQSESS
ncbi:sigma-54-dependent transcriptional regulator [Leucothrix mucor]|uniref:sigma-54-dependent transcriptional regulator n=1 Tax=Leucothrix mucor TaxID=45248 RepID=UPI0003B6AF7E|nr:sigma-54 dependent transcriptional regulator [Leucothrix mucor]